LAGVKMVSSEMDDDNRTEQLRKIKDEVINLSKSPLYRYRVQNKFYPVIGEGSHYAKIMFVGEAPGRNEAMTGRPFCGAAGRVLDELLALSGIKREEVYITNILKDRPPENRDPIPEEIFLYGPFLDRQIEIIQPKVIVALGRFAAGYLMEKFHLLEALVPISAIHGKVFGAESAYGKIKIIAQYHPAAALYGGGMRKIIEEDFRALRGIL